ncbi:2-phospho-L-lactate guanylyltransferase [Myxococcota bacterium]|nr:2-phospho-L-lactate guanylyltransferase [Myxococcota bacterium]
MISALVPLKGLASSKSRLLPHLGRARVEQLAIAMLGDVVDALHRTPSIDRVAVVTPDPRVAEAAKTLGADPLLDRYPDLNAALDGASAQLAPAPDDAVLVVLGDVAGVQAAEVEALITALEESGVVLAPSSDGGTSALLRRPWNVIAAGFGPNSARIHAQRAIDAGAIFHRMEMPSLAIDIDDAADIERFRASGAATLGARTRSLLEMPS